MILVACVLLAACSGTDGLQSGTDTDVPGVAVPALCHTAEAIGARAANCPTNPPPPPPPPPNCNNIGSSFSASPATVALGQSTTLTWSVSVPSSCATPSITVAGVPVGISGSMVVTPPGGPSFGYTLVANGKLLRALGVTVLPSLCNSICNTASACDAPCTTASLASSTCGQAGVCLQCSSSVCSQASCDSPCLQGTTLTSCNAWSNDTAGDADLDGIPDALENALALYFAPAMHLLTTDFRGEAHGDWGQLYSGSDWGGHWPFVVRPVTPLRDTTSVVTVGGRTFASGSRIQCGSNFQCLEIVYTFPYNWDTGGPLGIGDHRGDGEMYAVLVARKDPTQSVAAVPVSPAWNVDWSIAKNDATQWVGFSEFGTAHTCDQYDSTNWRFRTWRPNINGPAEIWVSESKHANYFSKSDCDNGACSGSIPFDPCWDTCDDINFTMVFANQYSGMGPLANAGEMSCHSHPSINHTTLYPGATPSNPPYASYDVWSDIPFGDDSVGRPLVLLRPGTLVWWQDDHLTGNPDPDHPYGPYQCWPGPTSTPPPPSGGGSLPPPPPCGLSGMCCELNPDGTCSLCAPANGECP